MEESGAWSDLQAELLTEILHKLPVKTIVQCKFVCKWWRYVTSDPFFTSNYKPKSPPISIMLIDYFKSRASAYEINESGYDQPSGHPHKVPINFREPIMVLGSCNGLVALYNKNRDFRLLNPWTREEKRVLGPSYLACFDFGVYGLCHNPSTNEYKAVLCSQCTSFFVVSFKDGNCKSKSQYSLMFRDMSLSNLQGCGTIVEGVPYWICCGLMIVYFDQLREVFRMISLPGFLACRVRKIVGLGALDGKLAVTLLLKEPSLLEVWAIKGMCWSNLYVLQDYYVHTISISARVSDDEVLIDNHDGYLTICNVRNLSLQLLEWLRTLHFYRYFESLALRRGSPQENERTPPLELVTFIPSLVSPNHQ